MCSSRFCCLKCFSPGLTVQNVPFHSQIHLLSSTKKILADNQCLVSVFIHFKFSPDIFFPLHYMVKLINTFLVQVFFLHLQSPQD